MKCVALLSCLLVVSAVSMAQASRGAKDMLAGISGAHKHAALISGVRELLPPLPEAASLELELLPKQGRALLTALGGTTAAQVSFGVATLLL